MDDILKNAYTEVNQILNILGNTYKEKIPEKLINLFENNQNKEYATNINKNTNIEDMEISRTALIIISILNMKYWETDTEKKEELKNIYDENEETYQDKINAYKNDDWLKKRATSNNNYEEADENEEKSLAIVECNNSFLTKVKEFFKKLFNRK